MQEIKIKTNAKLNLNLDIIGLDDRNYHLMEMIMQSIDLSDTITITKNETGLITLNCNKPDIPCSEKNICYKCAKAFFDYMHIENCGINIDIDKIIPQQAGMAGGSSNGAGVLVGLNLLFDANLSLDTLCDIGKNIGADIPFCIMGGTALVEGIGEKITKLPDFPIVPIVVTKPKAGISTQRAFSLFDEKQIPPRNNTAELVESIKNQDVIATAKNMYNALEEVANLNEISQIKAVMTSMGAKASLMTGSGSAVFGIFTDQKRAFNCFKKLGERYNETFLTTPSKHGFEIL